MKSQVVRLPRTCRRWDSYLLLAAWHWPRRRLLRGVAGRNTAEAAGIKVTFSKPVLVGRSKGYLWFPTLVRLSSGELVADAVGLRRQVNVAESTSMVAWSWDGGLVLGPAVEGPGRLTAR